MQFNYVSVHGTKLQTYNAVRKHACLLGYIGALKRKLTGTIEYRSPPIDLQP
jgi:hypothetical protein